MGGAAISGMALSAIGVFLVWTTFKATRDAANSSRKAARFAEETVVANHRANEYMRIASRPWLQIEFKPEGQLIIDEHQNLVTGNFEFGVSNVGETPALNVRIGWTLAVNAKEYNLDSEIQFIKNHENISMITFPIIHRGETIWPKLSANGYGRKFETNPENNVWATILLEYQMPGVDIAPFVYAEGFWLIQTAGQMKTDEFTLHHISTMRRVT